MARRLAHLCGRASARLFGGAAGGVLGVAERCIAVNGSKAANAFTPTQLWQTTSVRGFASENDSATGYADEFDFVSYPPPRAFVGQMAPDFEAPGNPNRSTSYPSTLRGLQTMCRSFSQHLDTYVIQLQPQTWGISCVRYHYTRPHLQKHLSMQDPLQEYRGSDVLPSALQL